MDFGKNEKVHQNTIDPFDVILRETDKTTFQEFIRRTQNREGLLIYLQLTSRDGQRLLYAPDAIRRNVIYNDVDPKLWVTTIRETETGLNFKVGDIVFEDFPKSPKYPLITDFAELTKKCGINANTTTLSSTDGELRQRWFEIGDLSFQMASKITDLDKTKLAMLHLGCFIWGSLAYEKELGDDYEYWKGKRPIAEIAKRCTNFATIYPSSATPIGNAFSQNFKKV